VLRDAPNAEKPQRFAALQSASCETPELCELKRVCVAGYQRHLHALSEIARARALIVNGVDSEAAKALDSARSELTQAAPQIAQCADAQGAAQRKYKL
jgi:hypothetical protein